MRRAAKWFRTERRHLVVAHLGAIKIELAVRWYPTSPVSVTSAKSSSQNPRLFEFRYT
jgi:hypothetical protein